MKCPECGDGVRRELTPEEIAAGECIICKCKLGGTGQAPSPNAFRAGHQLGKTLKGLEALAGGQAPAAPESGERATRGEAIDWLPLAALIERDGERAEALRELVEALRGIFIDEALQTKGDLEDYEAALARCEAALDTKEAE